MEKEELIRLENIGKRYEIGAEVINALQGVNLSIYKGEFVV